MPPRGSLVRQYLELAIDLRNLDRGTDTFEVAVLPSEVGESEPKRVPYRPGDLLAALQTLEQGETTATALIPLGESLAERLLPEGEVRDLVEDALKKAGLDGGVRLRLVIHDPELAQLPWEYTYWQRHRGERDMRHFLVLDPRVSMVRHEPLPEEHPVLLGATPERIRLVAAGANIPAYPPLELARERRAIQAALADFAVDGVTLDSSTFVEEVTRKSLFDALQGGADIFHFAGHGEFLEPGAGGAGGQARAGGSIVVAGEHGEENGEPISAGELATLLEQARVRLAVLGACDSGRRDGVSAWLGIAPALLEAGIAASVAMQYSVTDDRAIAFNRSFYRALAAGMSVDEAVSLGRLAMAGETPGNAEWGIPVLYTRAPDGVIFPRPKGKPSQTADELRAVVRQTVKTIEAGGKLTGVRSLRVGGATGRGKVAVHQDVETLRGEAVGIDGLDVGHPRAAGRAAPVRRARGPAGPAAVPAVQVEQRVTENLGSLTAISNSIFQGDVRVELDVGAQVYLYTEQTRRSMSDAPFDREVSPFPGLRPFWIETRGAFFGRGPLVGELERAVANQAVVLVQGPSGAGKTSLLMAGLAPRAIAEGLLVVRLEDYSDPAAIRTALLSQSDHLHLDLAPDASFASTVAAVSGGGRGTVVLILDQFERLFLLSPDAQAQFVAELVTCLSEGGTSVRVVLSVRDDMLGRLADVAAPLPGLLERPIRVNRLTRAEATAAIEEPLNRQDVAYDEGFIQVLLDDLDELSGDPAGDIEPGQLQIVCASLFDRARALRDQGHPAIISQAVYTEGAEAISVEYLQARLRLGLGKDQELGEAVLRSIVAARERDWLSPADLRLDGTAPEGVDSVLHRLTTLGVLVARRVQDIEYSVATPAVESILERLGGQSLMDQRRAGEVLQAIGLEWRVRGALARRGQLRFLAAAEGLAPTWSEAAVLLRSAAALGEPTAPWLSALARHPDESANLELRPALEQRETAATRLFGMSGAIQRPADDAAGFGPLAQAAVQAEDPLDRETALLGLSCVPDFEIRLDKAMLLLPKSARRARTVEAWAMLTDAGVQARHVTEKFGAFDRFRIALQRGRRRLRRERRRVLALSAGAGVGFGLALGLVRFAESLVVGVPPPLGELLFWLQWGALLGFAVTAAALAAWQLVDVARPAPGRPVPAAAATPAGAALASPPPRAPGLASRIVPILAGAASFGLAMLVVTVGNGYNPGAQPLIGAAGFVPGAVLAVVAVNARASMKRWQAAVLAIAVGVCFAALQAILAVAGGPNATLTILHAGADFSGTLTRTFPSLRQFDLGFFKGISVLEGFVFGTLAATGMMVGLRSMDAVVERWQRLEARAGD